jgi:hypothetical protein
MTIEVKTVVMPNDPQIIDPQTGRLTQAYQHYFGEIAKQNALLRQIAADLVTKQAMLDDHETRITALEP